MSTVSGNYEDDFGYGARRNGKTLDFLHDAVRALAKREAEAVEKGVEMMLRQPGPKRHGLLVEMVVPSLNHRLGDNTDVWVSTTTITLSPEVPFGTIAYKTTTKE